MTLFFSTVLALQIVAPAAAAAPSPAAPAEPAAVAPDSKKPVLRVAVYRLEGGGIDERVLNVLTDSVVKELRKLERVTVVGMDEIKAMLDFEAQKQILGCSDISCVAEIAEALGVDQVMIGNVAVVGETISFGLKLIDQQSATTVGQYANRVDSKDPADVLALIGPAIAELMPDLPLKAGQQRGVPPEIAARIHPNPLPPWVFFTVAGTGGTALLAGVAFTAWNAVAYQAALQKAEGSSAGKPVNGADLNNDIDAVKTSFIGLAVSYAAGAIIVAGAGVTFLFTDWDNARGAE